MERHRRLHLVEAIAVILLIAVYTALFYPFVYYFEAITYLHLAAFSVIFVLGNFIYGTLHTWWKHRNRYTPDDIEGVDWLYEYTEELSDEFDTRLPRIIILQTDVPNAYATDTLPTRPIIVLTTGLLAQLDFDELKSVLAHEMSHIRSYDVFFMLFLSTFVSIVEHAHRFSRKFIYDDDPVTFVIALVPFIFTAINLRIVYAIMLFVSRTRETVADTDAALATTPEDMKNALHAIDKNVDIEDDAAKQHLASESSLCIIPLEDLSSGLFKTHPSKKTRINRIDKYSETDDSQKTQPIQIEAKNNQNDSDN